MSRRHLTPIFQALLAALLFGASAPSAKLLLGDIDPIPLAAFLYLGSGLGVLLVKAMQRLNRPGVTAEAQLRRADLGWLAGAILAGGIAAPIVLLFGLQYTPAATAALLLNFESVATTLIAALVFKEAISRRAWWAILVITLASMALSFNPASQWGFSLGALGILAACLLWGIDNNFTRNISAKDPLTIVTLKGLGAGSFSLLLAIILGQRLPSLGLALGAMLLGSLSYGLSIVLFIRALRALGAARTSALFGTAPLAGMVLSLVLFKDPLTWLFILAIPLMLIGAALLINEEHDHAHAHEALVHEHSHQHDDPHHQHAHADGELAGNAHSHLHTHSALQHAHPHLPDIHHRHTHPTEAQ
jgi:drug/metabolite transporter (DMT)-like permease